MLKSSELTSGRGKQNKAILMLSILLGPSALFFFVSVAAVSLVFYCLNLKSLQIYQRILSTSDGRSLWHIRIGHLLCYCGVWMNTDFWCMSLCTMGWSLSSFLFGGASGLVYHLHEECSKQIIHCDIKPSEHNSWMILLQPKLQNRTGKASDKKPDLNTHRHQRDYGVYSDNSGSLDLL